MFALLKKNYHFFLALIGAILYRFPSRKIFVIGVTGTKGKTSVVELVSYILEKAGHRTALISSVHVKIGEDIQKNTTGNSMPGRFFIQRFLREAVKSGCTHAILEVTSQGVVQSRHRFIDFDAAVFTNLEPEHIEAHGSFEKYREAKLAFFRAVDRAQKPRKFFFINRDDENASYFNAAAKHGTIVHFGTEGESKKTHQANLGAAVSVAEALMVPKSVIASALEEWPGIEGRMEIVQEKPFRVVVDYAHTPNSLEFAYEHAKPKGGRLICVLGAAGGGRDKWKRPKLGEVAAKHCDEIVLTNEDPYDEDPQKIIDEIGSGISKIKNNKANVHEVFDRKEAIKKAVSLARKGDVVIMTGKGSERYIHLARGKKLAWSERRVVEEVLESMV